MSNLKPLSTSHIGFQNFGHPKLNDCTHVFLRVDKDFPSLSQPYTGLYDVPSKKEKHRTITINGKKSCLSLDRVKLVFCPRICPILFLILLLMQIITLPSSNNILTTTSGRWYFLQPL
ncbi:hypothetical protein TNCT_233691 [Trichonephila clavata]|uniref:Uncharacterized protein n=1 Tax=Trichonephila clavata TaxID=2740835 RepID=A0A8X6KIP0_TRICU|nr:hypothetical protein TNCT_233691 [Trichonephila clavata]